MRLLPVGWVEVGGVGWWALSRATVSSLSRHGDIWPLADKVRAGGGPRRGVNTGRGLRSAGQRALGPGQQANGPWAEVSRGKTKTGSCYSSRCAFFNCLLSSLTLN